jgi:hypothetical protein
MEMLFLQTNTGRAVPCALLSYRHNGSALLSAKATVASIVFGDPYE